MAIKERHERLAEEHKEKVKRCQELNEECLIKSEAISNAERKIEEYGKEVVGLKAKNEEYFQELILIRPKLEYLSEEAQRRGNEFKANGEQIIILTKINNDLEEAIIELKRQLGDSIASIKSKNGELIGKKAELERCELKIRSLEQEAVARENKKSAIEKEASIMKKLLQEKIEIVTGSLNAEVKARQELTLKYSNEEKAHIETKRMHSKAVTELEDTKAQLRSVKDMLMRKTYSITQLTEERNSLKSSVERAEAEKELLVLDKEKAEELIRKLEDYYKDKLAAKASKKEKLRKEHKLQLSQAQYMCEDLHSKIMQLQESLDTSIAKVFWDLTY